MKILCVEDDQELAKLLQDILVKKNYQVELAFDGQMGWDLAESYPYDIILLDLMLPVLDGINFCKQLRSNSATVLNPNRDTPILLMTALDEINNKIIGLDAGADDYVIKPFVIEELLARVRALLRRSKGSRSPILSYGQLSLNPNTCEVNYAEQMVPLASKEYEMLELFLRNPDRIFSSSQLLDRLWTSEQYPSEGAVRSHIKGLRKKLKEAGCENILETVYKLGYRLKDSRSLVVSNSEDNDAELQALSHDQSFSPELCQAWLESQHAYYHRFLVVKTAIRELQSKGSLSVDQRQQAEAETHTLIGSLGSFGLEDASHIALQIQTIFRSKENLDPVDIDQLQDLSRDLEKCFSLDGSPTLTVVPPPMSQGESTPYRGLLIVDNEFLFAETVVAEAVTWGIELEMATQLSQAKAYLKKQLPQLIILDLKFPNLGKKGLEFLGQLQAQHPEIPVMILTTENTITSRVEASRLGCQCFLSKPLSSFQILTTATQMLQSNNLKNARLMVVDDDPELLRCIEGLFKPHGYQLTLLDQPNHFWEVLEQSTPELLILDIELGDRLELTSHSTNGNGSCHDAVLVSPLNGIDLCKIIRSDPHWNRLPVIFLSAHTDLKTIQEGISAGADDFLKKPINGDELLNHVQARLQQRKLWTLSDLDELTGVSLRRKLLQDLTQLLYLARRQKQPLSFAILDLDFFKRINDQHGHDVGDQVLRYLGQLLNQLFRREDVVGRWGGDEFLVAMYGINKLNGLQRLTELSHRFSQHQIMGKDENPLQFSLSAGIAQFPEDGDDLQSLYHAADAALYRAKSQGRNQVLPSV